MSEPRSTGAVRPPGDGRHGEGWAQARRVPQVTGLAYEMCTARVPLINSPEEAARFLREVLAAAAAAP